MKSGLVIVLLGLWLVPLCGQEEDRAGIDLEDALKLLRELGWESVAEASWGRFESRTYPNDGGLNPYNNPYGSRISLQGNAWMQPGEEAQKVVYGGGFRAFFPQAKEKGKKTGFFKKLLGGGGQAEGYKWAQKSLENDLKTLHAWLASGSGMEEYQWQYQRKGTESVALILALQLYESGREEEGQKLADALMGVTLDGEALIDGLVSGLADRRLEDLTEEFCENKESRENYLRDLKKLREDFPRGWEGAMGVNRLVALMEKKDPNSIGLFLGEGQTLAPELMALLEEMAGAGAGLRSAPGVDWIWGGKVSSQMTEPFGKLCQQGMDGYLALAIAAGDETLTRRRLQGGGDDEEDVYRRMNYGFNNDGPDPEEIWQAMDRPATRGEFARLILIPVLPGDASEYEDLDGLGIQQEAMAFWKQHSESTPAQLAARYLEEGSSEQVVAAVAYLMENQESEALALFEKKVLAQPDYVRWSEAVKAYLKKGRGETREFWQKLRPEWEQQLENLDESDFYEMGMRSGSPKTVLKLMDRYAGGQTMAETLRTLAKEEDFEKVGTEFRAFAQDLEDESQEKRTQTVLKAIESSDSDAYLLTSFYYLSYFQPEHEELMGKGEEFWTEVLAKKEELPVEMTRGVFGSLAEFAAYVLEASLEKDPQVVYERSQVMGEQFYPYCLQRSEARMANGEVPAWPEADKVDKGRRKEMLAEIEVAPAAEKSALIESWSMDERMVWAQERQKWEEDDELPTWFRELRPVITESQLSEENQAKFKSLALGQEVSDEWLKELITSWPKDLPEADGQALNVIPAKSGMGLKIGLAGVEDRDGRWMSNYLDSFEESLGEQEFIHFVFITGDETIQVVAEQGVVPEDNEEWDGVLSQLKSYRAAAQGEAEEGEEASSSIGLYLVRVTADALTKMKTEVESEEEE